MNRSDDAIELGLALLRELVAEDPRLAAELQESAREFPGSAAPDLEGPEGSAARRHLEWFLLERPSEVLGGVPVEALAEAWNARAAPLAREAFEALLASRASAFRVTSVEAGEGVWVRDLLGVGELSVRERAASELLPGDLLVGRVYPAPDGSFHLSPAVACFRDGALADALQEDLQRARAGRRGPLRISQVEIERIFFVGRSAGALPPAESPDAARRTCLSELERLGLARASAEQVIADLEGAAREPDGGSAVTEVLNRLAFETTVDLEAARRALVALWGALSRASRESSLDVPAELREEGPRDQDGADPDRVREALADFDRGRARGEDLERLFGKLEAELGFEGPAEADEGDAIPDFPGVVAAMVEEFLWDVGRERGEAAARPLEVLRRLGAYGERIGVFENLGPRDLLDFAARWLLDEAEPPLDPSQAEELLAALEQFCRWSEERHALPLDSGFRASLEGLRASLPRVLAARAALASPAPEAPAAEPYHVAALVEGGARLRDARGGDRTTPVPDELAAHLQPGDLVHARPAPGRDALAGSLEIVRVYPPELDGLLDDRSS